MKMSITNINPILRHASTTPLHTFNVFYTNNYTQKNLKKIHQIYIRLCNKYNSYGTNYTLRDRGDLTFWQITAKVKSKKKYIEVPSDAPENAHLEVTTVDDTIQYEVQSHDWTRYLYTQVFKTTGLQLDLIIKIISNFGGGAMIAQVFNTKMSPASRTFFTCLGLYLLYADPQINFHNIGILEEIITNFMERWEFRPADFEFIFQKIARSARAQKYSEFFQPNYQPQVGSDDVLEYMRIIIDSINNIKDTPFGKKIYKLIMYLVSFGFSKFCGFDLCPYVFNKTEQQEIRMKYNSKCGFILSLMDSVLFLIERGQSCFEQASFAPLLVTVPGANEWLKLVSTLKVQYKYIANPEPHNFTWYGFLCNLDHALDMGSVIARSCSSASDVERRHYLKTLDDVRMMRADVVSKKSAQKARRAPFGILLFGSSSVAKSSFCNLLIHHYSKLYNLPNGDEYRYTRNANSDFWDGFTSSMWSVILDDIAYLKPLNQPDPTLTEMLQVVNNAAFVPNQADLDNKGRTPLKARLVIATTNTEHLNAHAYFACPVAIQRRLRYIIEIKPKHEYLASDGKMIDTSTLPQHVSGYPDYWRITVKLVTSGEENRAEITVLHEYDDIYSFLTWFNKVADEHERNQDQSDNCDQIMREVDLCSGCRLPTEVCRCCQFCHQDASECLCCETQFCTTCMLLNENCECRICDCCQRVGECDCCYECMREKEYCICFYKNVCTYCYYSREECCCIACETCHKYFPECVVCVECGEHNCVHHDNNYHLDELFLESDVQVGSDASFATAGESSVDPESESPSSYHSANGNSQSSASSETSTTSTNSGWFNWSYIQTLGPGVCKRGTGWFPMWCSHCFWSHTYNYLYSATALCYIRWRFAQKFIRIVGIDIPMPYLRYGWSNQKKIEDRVKKACMITVGILGVCAFSYYQGKKSVVVNDLSNSSKSKVQEEQDDVPPKSAEIIEENIQTPVKEDITVVVADNIDVQVSSVLEEYDISQPIDNDSVVQSVNVEMEDLLNKYGGQPIPMEKIEKESIWKKDDYCLTRLDVNHRTTSVAKCGISEFTNLISNNLVYIRIKTFFFRAICVSGNTYVSNNHCFPICDFEAEIITTPGDSSVSGNVKNKKFSECMLQRVPERDLVFFQLNCLPPRKCLLDFFPEETFRANVDGFSLARNSLGIIETIEVRNLQLTPNYIHQSTISALKVRINVKTNMWFGHVAIPTRTGHCGATLIGMSTLGPVILGLHFLGGGNSIGSVALTKNLVQSFVPKFNVVPGMPQLSTGDCERAFAQELHFKSPARYVSGVGNVYGSYTGFRARPKSNVEYTLLHPLLIPHNEKPIEYGKPVMNGWLPWHNAIKPMVEKPTKMDLSILSVCTLNYLERLRQLPDYGHMNVKQLDILTAINGQAGVRFIDSINRSTSMGEPYNHSKKFHLKKIPPYEHCSDPVIFDNATMEDILRIKTSYSKGERVCPIFHASLKDEALKKQKIIDGKTRVFSGGPAAWSVVVRMMLLPLVKILQDNQAISEIAVGVTAQSLQWEKLRDILTVHGDDKLIAGDYQNYDKSMIAELILSAFEILAAVLEENGCTDEHIHSVYTISYDVAFAYTNFNGDLIEFFGSNPSGQPLTVIINCIVNSLLIRYAYFVANPEKSLEEYNNCVSLLTYGDDNAMGVSDNVPWFNHTSIQNSLGEIGIIYTMADKNAPSIPYIHIDEVSFLKRTWRFDEDVGAYVCPLELASIEKMLNVCVASKTVTRGAQMSAIVSSAMGEYFWYGKEKFEVKRALLKKLMSDANLDMYVEEHTFPTWKQLRDKFWASSEGLSTRRLDALQSKPQLSESYCFESLVVQCGFDENGLDSIPARALPEISFQRCVAGTQEIGRTHSSLSQDCVQYRLGNFCTKTKSYANSSRRCGKPVRSSPISIHYDSDGEECNCKGFKGACCRQIFREYHAQVGETTTTMEFLDENEGDKEDLYSGTDSRVLTSELSTTGLDSFLSRPVKILTFTWNESDSVRTINSVFPWSAFFSNTNIAYKLNNYSFVRCTLRIKIMVNASPFYYGSMIAAYTPLQTDRPDTSNLANSNKSFIPLSQKPHVWINPQDSNGAELTLPFLYHKDWLNAQSNTDLADMGVIHFTNYTVLASANGVSGAGCTVSVYAWAEDVHVAGPSAGLAAQVGDEYGDKPISSIASAIAARAGSLSRVPILGKYATATQMGAKAIASVATRLGFSNPPVIDNVMPYRPTAFPNLSSTEISYPIDKLTIDPKCELAIDPTIPGASNEDELSITNFCKKESYLTAATWDTTQATDTILFHAAVAPIMYDSDSVTNYETLYTTPLSHVSQMFRYWRGDIIFRFRIIASKYHKGRVRFTFDPTGQGSNNIVNITTTQPTCFTQIIDLSEETDVAIKVPYMQALPWLRTYRYADTTSGAWWSTSASPSFISDTEYTNGSITLRVVNALTCPVATSTVKIQCFISSENIEFAAPRNLFQPYSFFAPQVGEIVAGTSIPPPSERYLSNFGEAIVSFRQLMRRSTLNWIYKKELGGSSTTVFQLTGSRLPRCGGFTSTGRASVPSIVTSGPQTFEFANMTPITWVTQCFVGLRGSTNWTFNSYGTTMAPHIRYIRDHTSTVGLKSNTIGNGVSLSVFQFYSICPYSSGSVYMSEGIGGSAITNQNTNSGLNISHPMYNNRLMEFVTPALWNSPATAVGGGYDSSNLNMGTLEIVNQDANQNTVLEAYVAAGTDFNPIFFLNIPVIYLYKVINEPS